MIVGFDMRRAHEIDAAIPLLQQDRLPAATRALKRIVDIEKLLVDQIHILESMTPINFLAFRDQLNPASGFQSMQFREIEFSSGLKDARTVREFANDPFARERLQARLDQPTLADAFYQALERRGFDVTIYAEKVPPDTTSNMSLAGFTPTSGLVANENRTPEWDAQFRQAVTIAYRQLQLLAGPKYGISWIYNYSPTDERPQPPQNVNQLLPDSARTGSVVLEPGQHPFPTKYAIEGEQMRIEPSIYLDALVQDVLASGGKIKIRKFATPRDLMALEESVIVNCTGLGARELFNDPELVPLKGQLIVMVPQDEVNFSTNGALPSSNTAPGLFVHMMPRHDGIVLGGTSQRGVWSTEIDEAERKRVVDAHIQLYAAMK